MSRARLNRPFSAPKIQFFSLASKYIIVAVSSACVFFSAGLADIQHANAQINGLNPNGKNRSRRRFDKPPTVFTGATRQLLRPLRLAENAIDKQNYEQACLLIGEMLDDDELKDCLVPDDSQWGYAISLRQKALKLLGTMNEDQRSAYRDKYATRSAQLLEKAVEERDYQAIEFISERYLYTDSGLEATMLLGHHWLNSGRPGRSATAFEKLLTIPRGRHLYDPELSLLTAIVYALSQQEQEATKHLKRLKDSDVDKITFFQREVSVYADDQPPLEWLASLIGDSPLKSSPIVSQWLMWRGNPQRNGETGPGLPLFSPRWSNETLGKYESATEFESWLDKMGKNQLAPVPKANLLTVGDTIVIRTAEEMMGIEATTGKRRWSFPGTDPELAGNYSDPKKLSRAAPESIEVVPQGKIDKARQAKFYERVLHDGVFSRIASNGKMVFCIPNPGVATTGNDWQGYRSDRFESPTDLRKYNELCAIDVASEGALVWQVGGDSGGDESKLARTFFLGSPLPLDGSLYCICVQDDLVKLVVLAALDGSLQWEKELASTEEAVSFTHDVVRRLAGATPSASDGIIVCPTGLNAIVAVDIVTRSLKWGFQLSQPRVVILNKLNRDGKSMFRKLNASIWRDTSLQIADGAIVYAPSGSKKELCCIDLKTGRSRWSKDGKKPQTLSIPIALYVAAVRNGEIILVTPGKLLGVDLDLRKVVWKIPFGTHGAVSGHGYVNGNSYYLPTTSKKLLRFDLSSKSISKVVDTGRVLGNLYPWNNDIISVGLDHVAAYPCDVKSLQHLETAHVEGEAPAPVRWKAHTRLAIKAQIKMQQGEYSDAASLISEAHDLFPNSSYADVLLEVLTKMIAVDFKRAEVIFQQHKGLFKQRDLRRLLRGKVNGLVKAQRYEEAFDTLLEIANGVEFSPQETIEPGADIQGSELVQLLTTEIDLSPAMADIKQNGVVEISRTSWLRWELSQLSSRVIAEAKMDINSESKITKDDLVGLVVSHLEPFEEQDPVVFFQRLQLFPQQLIGPDLLVETAQRLLADQKRVEAKSLLTGDRFDGDVTPEVTAKRLKLLGQIAIDQQDVATAKALVNRLNEKDADANDVELTNLRQQTESLEKVLGEGIYDDQLYLELARDRVVERGPRYDLDGVQWKREVAEIEEADYVPYGDGRLNCVILETDIQEIHKLKFRYEPTRGELQIHDSLGRQVRSVYLRPNGDAGSFSSGTTGKLFLKNSVMLFCIGQEIFALDWIQMVRGKESLMWSIRLEQGPSRRNVFGGPSSSGVCFIDGSELKCVDLFTGQLRWIRNRIPSSSMIKEGGDRITIWNDTRSIYETFDKLSGRRLAGGKISSLSGTTTTGHNNFHLFQTPIRGGASEKQQKSMPEDPFPRQPYTDLKLQLFDFEVGEVAWERTFPFPTVFHQVDQSSIAVLTRDGILSMLDLPTGKVKFEKQVDGLKDISVLKLSVMPMAQGYVFVVNTSESRESKVKQGDSTEVKLYEMKGRCELNNGYVFSVDHETGESQWDKPVLIESFGFLEETPYNSPFLMLLRRATYRTSAVGKSRRQAAKNKPRIQVAMLDVATGQLKSNHLFEATVGNEPRCQLVCRPGKKYQSSQDDESEQDEGGKDDDQNQRLELLIANLRLTIKLTDSKENSVVAAPAVLSNEESILKLKKDEVDKVAEREEANLLVDLKPMAQRAKEANDKMLELGKFEAELFEKQRETRQKQR